MKLSSLAASGRFVQQRMLWGGEVKRELEYFTQDVRCKADFES